MFRHVGIVVKDLEKQLQFYKDYLGLEVYYSQTERGLFLENLIGYTKVEPLIYKLGKNNNTIVELLYFKDYELVNNKKLINNGITNFALTVENLDELYIYLKNKGINFVNTPSLSEDKKYKVCFCQDYDLNYIELVEKIK
jgi:catechol 2,3-dioxygenase-like lactoylglutathione lyase family enzyme